MSAVLGPNYRYMRAVRADNPVAYWRLGESSGTTAIDEMKSFNGTYSGTYTLGNTGATTDNKTSFGLTGVTGKMTANPSSVIGGTVNASMESWIYRAALGKTAALGFSSTVGQGFHMTWFGDVMYCSFGNGSSVTFSVTQAIFGWHHFAMTYDGTNLNKVKIYVDGKLISSSTDNTGPSTLKSAATIGVMTVGMEAWDNVPSDCLFQDVILYTKTLTPAQVLNHYNAR